MIADFPVAVTMSVETKSGLPNPGSKVIFLTEPSCSSVTASYELGQNLGCDAANAQLSMCYPEDCDTQFSLSDFEGKIIWIIYEADW